ncbi:hypothetical protein Rxyl_0535 [Rubrobacter xylanophilus DSM 9941]|uniref:Uncharacterized protein n=1 Tax=Rubrobacter xylanophilus (strain DSM 9941 / JCM 11954 / NBRC 16129 / PRD-1) TaxID=266117 RepID=Q1AYL9_RUBXD|nr:hypothetical protein [Rubrobacter xylanophilus]ABG03509.1 hypothetical protein Rxyl_0535 [Rubrobacter xylanophilus DSM 9941]
MKEPGAQLDGRLAVAEVAGAYLVVREADPADWLVRFEKSPGFPAREWAENMASIYNRRLELGGGPPTPPGTRPPGYHP